MAYMICPFDYNHNSRLFLVLSNRYHLTILTYRYCQPQSKHQYFCTDLNFYEMTMRYYKWIVIPNTSIRFKTIMEIINFE